MNPRADFYISVDIEADGPIPGSNSMLSFGLAAAGRFDGGTFESFDPGDRVLYRELRPISDEFDPEALKVSGLDRAKLQREGTMPAEAMTDASEWIRSCVGRDRAVLVGFPIVYDWLFFYWYLRRFGPPDLPVGFSDALDIKTMFQAKAGVVLDKAGKDDLPAFLKSSRPHTHKASDDAIEQGALFSKLFEWPGVNART